MKDSEQRNGIVYILSNRYMPGVLKISKTVAGRGQRRVEELFTTGVPAPFNVEYAAYVDDSMAAEGGAHAALWPYRTHPQREFFEIDPGTAKQALGPWDQGDATPELLADRAELDNLSLDAGQRFLQRGRRRNMDFFAMGLRPGDALWEKHSGRRTYVEDRYTIYFEGQHGETLNGIYKRLHGTDTRGTWYTENGHKVSWLFDHVQHGNEQPPWKRRTEA